MTADRDPIPTIPETPRDIFEFAEKLAQSGTYDPDLPGYGMVFYGRATVGNKPNIPMVIKSQLNSIFKNNREVIIRGTKDNSTYEGRRFYFSIIQKNGSDEYISYQVLPSSLGKMLSTVTRDEKVFEADRKKAERERAEADRVDDRRRRRA